MEEKFNHATPQRPDGARPLDAAILPIDMLKYISQIKREEAYNKNGKNAITIFKTKQVTLTIVALKARETLHPGNEEGVGILIFQVIDGEICFKSLDEELKLTKNSLLTLNQQLSFNAKALKDSICLITLFK